MIDINNSNYNIINQEAIDNGINSEFGTYPNNRTIRQLLENGMIILDKHAGPTSHEVVAIVKKILNIEKAGHSGTLDPGVTGVLPVGLNESTKILHTLLLSSKEYVGILRSKDNFPLDQWETIAKAYEGQIYQVPPLKSNVVKKLRRRRIYDLKILETEAKEVLFRASCQAGTYIRTLCVDMGRTIGSSSYMKELRRTKSGPFSEKDTVTLTQIFDAFEDYKDELDDKSLRNVIIPIEEGITHLPMVILRDNAIDPVCHGTTVNVPAIIAFQKFRKDEDIALITSKRELIGLGVAIQSSELLETSDNGSIIKPNRIIMKRNTYPRYLKD